MTRLARRNRTRRIKLWKRRGYKYMRGSSLKAYRWRSRVVVVDLAGWDDVPLVYEDTMT